MHQEYSSLCPAPWFSSLSPVLTAPSPLVQMYKDDNHKPEMALALEDFEALSSFVSHEELVEALRAHPELRACVGEAQAAGLEGCDEGSRKQVRHRLVQWWLLRLWQKHGCEIEGGLWVRACPLAAHQDTASH
jgi:hypothetical protein